VESTQGMVNRLFNGEKGKGRIGRGLERSNYPSKGGNRSQEKLRIAFQV